MQTIWKFPLKITDLQLVEIPARSTLLRVGTQDGTLYMWALVDPNAKRVNRAIYLRGTGHGIIGYIGEYVGTTEISYTDYDVSSTYVWHVFGVPTDLPLSKSNE